MMDKNNKMMDTKMDKLNIFTKHGCSETERFNEKVLFLTTQPYMAPKVLQKTSGECPSTFGVCHG